MCVDFDGLQNRLLNLELLNLAWAYIDEFLKSYVIIFLISSLF